MGQICTKCKKFKALSQFRFEKRRDGLYLRSECKECRKKYLNNWRKKKGKSQIRNYNLKSYYGINSEDYLNLLKLQQNKCAICSKIISKYNKIKHFYIDHNHKTGKIRGLLCHNCNCAIGYFKDSPQLCSKASEYLIKSKIKEG